MFLKSASLNIVFYTREGKGQAGYEIRSRDVVNLLHKAGFTCKILSLKNLIPDKHEKNLSLFAKLILNLKSLKALAELRPKIIVVQRVNYHIPALIIYLLIYRVRLILDIDDWEFREDLKMIIGPISNSISETISRLLCKLSKMIVVSSDFLKSHYRNYSDKIIKIPSTVSNTPYVLPDWEREVYNCVWVGSLDSGRKEIYREIHDLISSFINFSNEKLKLLIIATGDLTDDLKSDLMNRAFKNIVLYENLSRLEVANVLEGCHFGLLPLFHGNRFFKSKSPVKLFEYMRNGLIPVASAFGEAPLILKNSNTGFITTSSKEMVEAINTLSNKSKKELEDMSKRIRNSFETDLSLDVQIKNWIDILS